MFAFPVYEKQGKPSGRIELLIGTYPGQHGYLCRFDRGATEDTVKEFFSNENLRSATREAVAALRSNPVLGALLAGMKLAILEEREQPPSNPGEDVSDYVFVGVHT